MTKPKTLEQLRAEKEEQRHSFYRNSTSWSVWRIEKNIWNSVYKPQFRQKRKKITQPRWAATPRNSDAHKRIAVPKALCVLLEYTRPRPKSGKVCRSDTRPGGVCERAERSEGSDTPLIRNTPVSPCVPLCAIL